MHYIGIDWAMEKHDVCVLNAEGQVVSEFIIRHDWQGFQQLHSLLQMLEQPQLNLERSDGLLVDWLIAHDWPVYMIHPSVLAHRRPRRNKDDRRDAYLLAYLLRMGDPECRLLVQQSSIVQQLKQAVIAYDDVVVEQRRLANRLFYVLRQYYPAVIHAFPCVYSLTGLAFLEAYPTPAAAQALTLDQLNTFLQAQHYSDRTRQLQRIYTGLQQIFPTASVPDAYVLRLQTLIPLLRCLHQQRSVSEKRMLTLFQQHPEAAWWAAFPGAGPITAARLLAFIGDCRARFPTAEALQAVAGTSPVTRRSGKQIHVEFRHACSHPLREAATNLARNSIRKSGWARSYFHAQLARGHSQSRAYRALANRWMNILWKLWQTGERYSEAKHVANRSRQVVSG